MLSVWRLDSESVTLISPHFILLVTKDCLCSINELEKKMGCTIFHNVLHLINAYSWSPYHFLVSTPSTDYSNHFNPTQHYSSKIEACLSFYPQTEIILTISIRHNTTLIQIDACLSFLLNKKIKMVALFFKISCHITSHVFVSLLGSEAWGSKKITRILVPRACVTFFPLTPSNWVSFMSQI